MWNSNGVARQESPMWQGILPVFIGRLAVRVVLSIACVSGYCRLADSFYPFVVL